MLSCKLPAGTRQPFDFIRYFLTLQRYLGFDKVKRDSINESETVKGWIYHGESNDAFSDADQYLGPFNGHVNGACIMKEIHQ